MIEPISGISFCISTNGQRTDRTFKCIESIFETMRQSELDFEIIAVGKINALSELKAKVELVRANDLAHRGQLSSLRNLAAARATKSTIVFLDDDIIFSREWATRLTQFSKKNPWKVLGNRVLSPDGTRYWDRATVSPHQMVSYDHSEDDPNLYLCGCFWVIRQPVFQQEKWDESILFYNENTGGINEDVEYSKRLINKGFTLSFDKVNLVWHWDDGYTQYHTPNAGLRCIRKEDITKCFGVYLFPSDCQEFSQLLKFLSDAPIRK